MGSISNSNQKQEFLGDVDLIVSNKNVFICNIIFSYDAYSSLEEIMNKIYGKPSSENKTKELIGTKIWNDHKNGFSFILGNGKDNKIMITIVNERS